MSTVEMRCPYSGGVVTVDEELAEKYWADGWRKVADEPAEDEKPKRTVRTRKS